MRSADDALSGPVTGTPQRVVQPEDREPDGGLDACAGPTQDKSAVTRASSRAVGERQVSAAE